MPETTQDLIVWIIGALLINLSTLAISIISWVKSAKMMPKEIKGADLNNISKEISIANQYDELATKAAEKALKLQERLDKIEDDYDSLSEKVDAQDIIIKQQAAIIKEQSARLDAQDTKIKEQEEEIENLKCELNNSQLYNYALISQMKEKNIIPVEISSLNVRDCKKRTKEKKLKENTV